MAVFSFSRDWRKVALFSLVLVSAAIAGAWSEVVAQAPFSFQADFLGPSLVAHWDDFTDGVSSEADAWVVGGGSAGRAPTTDWGTTNFAVVLSTDWTQNGVVQVSARGPIDPSDLFVERDLTSARLNAEIAGTRNQWTPAEDWSPGEPVTVSLILDLMGEKGTAMQEDSLQRTSDPFSGDRTDWHTEGRVMQVTGVGTILVDDEPLVPPNTATDWAETRVGQVSMQLREGGSRN
jgi:hypothetical protein